MTAAHTQTQFRNSILPTDMCSSCVTVHTCLYRNVLLSNVFLTKGDFFGRVELSLSLRYNCKVDSVIIMQRKNSHRAVKPEPES